MSEEDLLNKIAVCERSAVILMHRAVLAKREYKRLSDAVQRKDAQCRELRNELLRKIQTAGGRR